MGIPIWTVKFVWHWLNKIDCYWDVARIHTVASLCGKLSHPAAMYTISVVKHKGSVWNGRLGCSTEMEFFSLKLKWNMKLRTGFSSWGKAKCRDQNKVLDKKTPTNQQTKNPHQHQNPEHFSYIYCVNVQSFSQFFEKFPTNCKQNVYVSWHLRSQFHECNC